MTDSNTIPVAAEPHEDHGDRQQERRTWISEQDHQELYDILESLEIYQDGYVDDYPRSAVIRLRRFVEATYRDAS